VRLPLCMKLGAACGEGSIRISAAHRQPGAE
jgi:hypothetical protein